MSPEIVRELLSYDPETGIFTWRWRGRHWFSFDRIHKSWNTKYAGKRAGSVWTKPKSGYRQRNIAIQGRLKKEHHLAWLYMTDEPLPEEIDHINRDATDNRWENLRSTTPASNSRNRSMSRTNNSGVTGVTWRKTSGRWRAQCGLSGKIYHLGYFDNIDEAAMEVLEFRAEYGFDTKHGIEISHYHRSAKT